jgi:hypothetical protein
VNEVTLAGAIASGVIATEDLQRRATAARNLRHERHQVVWNTLWVLANLSADMRAARIEVAADVSAERLALGRTAED